MVSNVLVPIVIENTGKGERSMDIYSKMLDERIVFMNGQVEENMAQIISAQLLFLDYKDRGAPISLYINSPGGSVHAGLAIYDTMQFVKSPVHTIVMGMAASMGSFIAQAGAKGNRFVLPESTTMIHRVSSGTRGTSGTIYEQDLQWKDMEASRNHSIHLNERLTRLYAKHNSAGKKFEEFLETMKHDTWLTAHQAVEWGLADKVVDSLAEV